MRTLPSNCRFEERIENDLATVTPLVESVSEMLENAGIAHGLVMHVALCIEELIVNTISYGYPDGRKGSIKLDLDLSSNLTIQLSDDADPFDPFSAPEPNLKASLEDRAIGGLGVHVVRRFMDSFTYSRRGSQNVVMLDKRLNPAGDLNEGSDNL